MWFLKAEPLLIDLFFFTLNLFKAPLTLFSFWHLKNPPYKFAFHIKHEKFWIILKIVYFYFKINKSFGRKKKKSLLYNLIVLVFFLGKNYILTYLPSKFRFFIHYLQIFKHWLFCLKLQLPD